MDIISITAIVISILSFVVVISFVTKKSKREQEVKNDTQDAALKVDFFEDKINEAHEKLANVVSYQYADVISKIDDLRDRLESEDVLHFRSAYAKVSDEDLVKQAKALIYHTKKAASNVIQAKFGIGYLRANLVLDLLEKSGYVGPKQGAKPREVLLTLDAMTDEDMEIYRKIKSEAYGDNDSDGDELYEAAKDQVITVGKASASLIQRRLGVGYARAARLLDILEENGVIGPGDGAKPREVYINPDGTVSQETESA